MIHALGLVVVGLLALAGFWQLDRLSQRRERNALIRDRRAQPVATIEEFFDDTEAAAHRRVRAFGRYDTGRELVLLGRTDERGSGNHVLTPIVLPGGRALIVDRGWVPPDFESAPIAEALPPDGRVDVSGVLLPTEGRGPLAPGTDEKLGEVITRVDVARISRSLPYRNTLPLYLVLQRQEPAQGDLPIASSASPPELDEGPHLIYAIQWFLFIAIALGGYGAILRREARKGQPSATSV